MTIAAILLGLILVTMVVLVRRANYETEDADWFDDDDDYDEDDYYDEEEEEIEAVETLKQPAAPKNLTPIKPVTSANTRPTLALADITRLATEAGRLG